MRATRSPPARERPTLHAALRLAAAAACLALPGALGACGKEAVSAPTSLAPPLDILIADPSAPPPPVVAPRAPPVRPTERAAAAPEAAPEALPEPDPLPKTWTAPIVPGLAFADALRKARAARDAHGRFGAAPSTTKEAELKAWFTQGQAFADQASRMYAAAFHAPDAPREGRIEAIAEAAELDMRMARSLDEAGLGVMPQAWRADPTIASSFEDVAVGPTRRWRDEARVLARQCMQTARELVVVSDAAQRCAALRTGVPPRTARRAPERAPDARPGCACAPGDPLCSASLGGWCGAPP
jgi:hypothetical protein